MASVTKKPNGTYLVRVSAGKDDYGRQITVSRTFTPSRPNLSYASLQKEIGIFTDSLESQILRSTSRSSQPKRTAKTERKDTSAARRSSFLNNIIQNNSIFCFFIQII